MSRDQPTDPATPAEIQRRHRMDQWTPAEKAIYDAVQAVEAMPADVRLTNAVILLGQARDAVADFVDGVEAGAAALRRETGLEPLAGHEGYGQHLGAVKASAPAPAWQEMATAPKDGTPILAFVPAKGRAFACWWEAVFEYVYLEDDEGDAVPRGAWTDNAVVSFGMEETAEYEPTHWMPLPAPPTVKGEHPQ